MSHKTCPPPAHPWQSGKANPFRSWGDADLYLHTGRVRRSSTGVSMNVWSGGQADHLRFPIRIGRPVAGFHHAEPRWSAGRLARCVGARPPVRPSRPPLAPRSRLLSRTCDRGRCCGVQATARSEHCKHEPSSSRPMLKASGNTLWNGPVRAAGDAKAILSADRTPALLDGVQSRNYGVTPLNREASPKACRP